MTITRAMTRALERTTAPLSLVRVRVLRMSPPLIMDEKFAELGLSLIEEAVDEVEKQFGYR